MFDPIIKFSLQHKLLVGGMTLVIALAGIWSFSRLPIDAIPDITNNQAQVLTVCPSLSTTEVEQFVTAPVEMAVRGIPGVLELRSISRFGLSVVTVVFSEDTDKYLARQLLNEKLREAEADIPAGFGTPELAPISTGLGEILHYRIEPKKGYENKFSPTDLRTIQDWIVKRQLMGIPGVVEINSFGGYLKQYEVAVSPDRLRSLDISIGQVLQALEQANENSGGAYLEKNSNIYFIRTEGVAKTIDDIRQITVANRNGAPVLIANVADVRMGHALRYGAVSHNAEGEIVLGIVMMLKGENASQVIGRVKMRLKEVEKTLPEGVTITTFLDREKLVQRTIHTVQNNLIEGALIVVLVLVLLVGNLRAGLIIASVIPLSMLFAISMMSLFGVTANLMSLGAIDFGLIIDGAVIVVEATLYHLHTLAHRTGSRKLDQAEMDESVFYAGSRIMRSSVFGVIIILIVYLPILSLVGVEGKMFRPMAQTVSFALLGALLLTFTYVPVVSSLFFNKTISDKPNFADKFIAWCQGFYELGLNWVLHFKGITLFVTAVALCSALWLFSRLGGEFIPTLDEGDIMMHGFLPPGSSLSQTLESHRLVQKVILEQFPDEVEQVISKIGSAEIPTDPMAIETADNIILLKDPSVWTKAETKAELVEQIEATVTAVPGMAFEFTQPIKMRFDEMMTGVRSDIAVKIFGDNLDTLVRAAQRVEALIRNVPGLVDLKSEQVNGQAQIVVQYRYDRMARYGLHPRDLNQTVRAAFAGATAGTIFEDERRFDLVLRLDTLHRQDIADVAELPVITLDGKLIPLSEVADVQYAPGAAQISRDEGRRRIVVSGNVRGRDVESAITDVQQQLTRGLRLPPGYRVAYGGQFENLQAAKARLSIAVPVALLLIFLLLWATFQSVNEALLIFTAIPLSAIGGVLALGLRGMPFSISAGVGFIALFGVAVLNGIVMIASFNQLKNDGVHNIYDRIRQGALMRLRPVLMTAAVASLGFLPMALSHGAGAEVQRPLATVVIGGLISSTLLTLLVLPVLYALWFRGGQSGTSGTSGELSRLKTAGFLILFGLFLPLFAGAQTRLTEQQAIERILEWHPALQAAEGRIQTQLTLAQARPVWSQADLYQSNAADPDLGVFGTSTLGLNQAFPARKQSLAQQNLHARNADLMAAQKNMTQQQVLMEVRDLYRHLSYLDRKNALFRELDSLYQQFSRVAALRRQTGEAGLAEQMQAQDRVRRVRLELETINHETAFDYYVLGQLLGLAEPVEPIIEPFHRPDYFLADTARLQSSTRTQMAIAGVPLAKAQQDVAAAQSAMQFQAGLNLQYLANNKLYPGYQVGLALPLARKGIRQRTQVAGMGVKVAEAEYEQVLLEQHVELGHLLHEVEKYEILINYYESDGLKVAKELRRNASVQYQQAAMGYLEFLQNTEAALHMEMDYLENLYSLNRTVLELDNLLGIGSGRR